MINTRDGVIEWLTDADIASINEKLISAQTPHEPVGVLSYSGLCSAQYRAIQYQHYTHSNDVYKLGAVFAEAIVQNHPFFNANKRTAAAAVMVFLLLNGRRLNSPWEQVVGMFEGLAKHEFDLDDFECWLAHWSKKFDTSELDGLAASACEENITIKRKMLDV